MKIKFLQKPPTSELPYAIGVPAMIWQVLFFYLPLAILAVSSILAISETGAIEGITFSKIQFFLNPLYLKVIASSFLLALSNAVLCLLIAYPLAYFLAFAGKKYNNFFLFLLIVPFWTNFLLHVYAWFFVLEKQGFLNNLLTTLGLMHNPVSYLNTPFAIMIMMVYYYLPFMVMPLYSSLERMDMRVIEASYDLGASWQQTLRRVILPLTKRGLKAGFFLVYIPSFGEFAIPELMGGDRFMFVGSVVANYILGDETGSLGAAFTVVSSIFLLLSSIILYFIIDRLIPGKQNG
ncbi:MAG: ABC transporter permease [Parachlamydiales bacterium]|nr:ABC transporter permease [Verrucomicrobiota bacterium]MBX3719335.1 ABC transporter permease [Candidatus Acheromyda pituitae]